MKPPRIYGGQWWTGNLHGRVEDFARCVESIFDWAVERRCSGRRGHGPDGEYCPLHAFLATVARRIAEAIEP